MANEPGLGSVGVRMFLGTSVEVPGGVCVVALWLLAG